MTPLRAVLALVLLSVLGFGAATWMRPSYDGLDAVRRDGRLSLRVGSKLDDHGQLTPGRAQSLDASAHAADLASLLRALSRVPQRLAPARVPLEAELELTRGAPSVRGVEYHPQTGSLLLSSSAGELHESVWLHELAHLRLRGERPSAALPRRLIAALEEGVADYYAAAVAGSPRLGTSEESRDLTQPPDLGDAVWASLAFAGFDTHRAGWSLAARCYRLEPTAGALLDALVACLDGPTGLSDAAGPRAAVTALIEACPAASRERVAGLVADWLPPALFFSEAGSP